MSCPKCKRQWLKVAGHTLICACGYHEEVKVTIIKSAYTQLKECLEENALLKKRIAELEHKPSSEPLR